jgi:periplasmic protein TonB
MAAAQTIFDFREEWKGSLTLSAVLHVTLFAGAIGYSVFEGRTGESWGGAVSADGAMKATLVSSAVPLPSTPTETENVLANESKGLSESKPAEKIPEPEAVPIPEKAKPPKVNAKEKAPVPKPKTPQQLTQQAANVIPYGQGGPTSMYSLVKTDIGTGGISLGENGSFGSRYSWYVDTVRRKVSENWLKYEVDPTITNAKRVYITFDIGRNGVPSNIQVSQSSGVPSLDLSAKRALQRIDTFGPLPNDYNGGKVSVEFWFDYKK